jgi:hypothetical protein
MLDLSIGPWMSDGDIPDVDPTGLAILLELVVVKVGPQVCDDAMGLSVAVYEFIHLVNLSIATKTLLNPPGAVGRGPIMSSPQQAKGHVCGIVTSL